MTNRPTLHRLDAMLARALGYAGIERENYIDQVCGADSELRARLERLLEAADADNGLLRDEPAPAIDTEGLEMSDVLQPFAALDNESAGTLIGPFELREELGRGGMGIVWRAERVDGGFEQEVALKLVRGGSATSNLAQRFLLERQILAKLEHPGIARLMDGGVDELGRPWFALELVTGQALLEHCREQRLSLRERLVLFAQIVSAVDYAHRHLLVHRDIKPANVMVAAEGQVKLLDFGIAKLLDESSGGDGPTLTRLNPMTPQYASPEQLLGEKITTASDIYQLGLLLYELVTDRPPFDTTSTSASALVDSARSRRSLQPSKVANIPADLDAIVMMATRPEPERRYTSAGRLSDDIHAFLQGRPVVAQGDSLAYRLRRFAARHRVGVTGSALAVVAAVGLVAAVVWGYVGAERERQRAEAISSFLKDTLRGASPLIAQGRDTTLLMEIIDEAASRIDSELADSPYAAADVHLTLASTLQYLSDYERGAFHADAAARGFESRLGPLARETLSARMLQGLLSWDLSRFEEAERILTDVYSLARREYGSADPLTLNTLTALGLAIRAQGRLQDAEPYYRESVDLSRETLGNTDEVTIGAIGNLAFLLAEMDQLDEAEPFAQEAAALSRAHLGENHADTWLAVDKYAALLGKQGRLDEALTLHREAADGLRRLLGERHSTTLGSNFSSAIVLRKLQRYDEAITILDDVARVVREEFGASNRYIYPTLKELGRSLLSAGRPQEAVLALEESRRIAHDILGPDHHDYALISIQYADAQLEVGDTSKANALLSDARAVLQQAFGADGSHRYFDDLARVEARLAALEASR